MAIVLTLLAKERKGPKIDFQLLFYPVPMPISTMGPIANSQKGPGLPSLRWNGFGMRMNPI